MEAAEPMTEARVEIPIALRGLESPDLELVYSSWLSTFRSSPTMRGVPNRAYYAGQHARIERLIREGAVLCAVNPNSPSQIYGWCCTSGGRLHFVCVKPTYQRMGVARRLLAPLLGAECVYTHRTGLLAELPIPARWSYDPFALEASDAVR